MKKMEYQNGGGATPKEAEARRRGEKARKRKSKLSKKHQQKLKDLGTTRGKAKKKVRRKPDGPMPDSWPKTMNLKHGGAHDSFLEKPTPRLFEDGGATEESRREMRKRQREERRALRKKNRAERKANKAAMKEVKKSRKLKRKDKVSDAGEDVSMSRSER